MLDMPVLHFLLKVNVSETQPQRTDVVVSITVRLLSPLTPPHI